MKRETNKQKRLKDAEFITEGSAGALEYALMRCTFDSWSTLCPNPPPPPMYTSSNISRTPWATHLRLSDNLNELFFKAKIYFQPPPPTLGYHSNVRVSLFPFLSSPRTPLSPPPPPSLSLCLTPSPISLSLFSLSRSLFKFSICSSDFHTLLFPSLTDARRGNCKKRSHIGV